MSLSRLKNDKRIQALLILIAVFVFFAGYFVLLLFRHTSSDIQAHAGIAYAYAVNGDKLFPNFLYFFLVAFLSGFSANMHIYYAASVVLIAAAVAAKFFISKKMLQQYCGSRNIGKESFLLPAVMMLFVFALPSLNFFNFNQYYYGQLPPNVWHNSTVIFLMPFSILLFFSSCQLLYEEKKPVKPLLIRIFILVIINALIKPSFLFTIIPAVGIIALFKAIAKRSLYFAGILLPYVAGVFVVALQYYLIFKQNHISGVVDEGTKSDVSIAPFEVWSYYSVNMLWSFVASCFFPLVYFISTKAAILKKPMVQLASLNYLGAVAVWVLFAETGFRKYHANFCWQAIVASYLLFLTLLIQFIKDSKSGEINKWQRIVTGGAFLLHFVWGVVYWLKIIIFKTYI